MARGQDLTKHQRGIIKRYYNNRDTIMLNKLSEIVSELYVAETDAKRARLWKSAETALGNLKLSKPEIERATAGRDPAVLARVLTGLNAK